MSTDIVIDDLRNPILSDIQKAGQAWGDANPVIFSEEAVLEHAQKVTGLSDFGPEDFRERLSMLVDEWNADRGISNIHRHTLLSYINRYAVNRLLIRDMLNKHPEIHNETIERPIIVAGLPRSGTTHMVNILAADQRLRSLPLWESYEPLPMPGEPTLPDGTDPRYKRCADAWDQLRTSVPLLAAMHPMEPDHIHEELELMGPDFASYNFEWISKVPKWRDHYYATDQTPHYEYMKTALKMLQRIRGPKRWVLKCPQHLEQLPVLKKVFPDATVVITHRDPVAVIQSAITMMGYTQRFYRNAVEPENLFAYWSDRIEHLLRACVKDRAVWPEAQSFDSYFHQFMKDDMGQIEKIEAKAGLAVTPAVRAQIDQFLKDHPRGKEGRVIYNLKRDFGISADEVRARFKFYFDAFPDVKAEVD
jgi:hypothetical protein